MANTTQDIENLAAQIGDNIYIDVAKWHLYLREAHLHSVVAEKVFPLLENNSLSENAVMSILREIKVTLGGGHLQVSLADLLPSKCQIDLIDLLEEYQKSRALYFTNSHCCLTGHIWRHIYNFLRVIFN